jgi:hydantoinase/carbamoylase family amidase
MPPLIDEARLWRRIMMLAEIGATPAGGVNRQALTKDEIEAWRVVIGWAHEGGLEPSTDAAGNLFLTLRGGDPQAAPLLVGSHLDSQPTGGRFDGVVGVLAGLEAVVAMAERRQRPTCDIVVVAWMNEEGCRFAPGMMGSEAFVGVRSIEEIRATRDVTGLSVGEALDTLHRSFPDVPHRPLGFAPGCYLELHIEQGPLLEAEARVIGVVTGIQGKKTFEVTIEGGEGHAGTVPMAERRDAIASFARMASVLHAEIGGRDSLTKFTIGRLLVEPNAPSVVPARVTFSIDLRHPDNAILNELGDRLVVLCRDFAPPCAVAVKPMTEAKSNDFDPRLRSLIARLAAVQGHRSMSILSAAGHDARHLAKVCPSAMIFIPCRDGVSHAEYEWVEPAHLAAGASVLAHLMAEVASAGYVTEVTTE